MKVYTIHRCDLNEHPKGGDVVSVVLYDDHLADIVERIKVSDERWKAVIMEKKEPTHNDPAR